MTHYESLAIDYANQALVLRAVATVHLENMNDEFFWKPILESIKPGTYNFIGTSKNKNDKETSGCAQCLNFKGYLSKSFFVCMDSDYRLLDNGEPVSVNDFFAQTYTYSWENHLCFADDLQKRLTTALTGKTPYIAFDFKVFLSKLSEVVYPIVLQYLSMRRNGREDFTKKHFNELFNIHPEDADYSNNGDGIIDKLNSKFSALQTELRPAYNMDFKQESDYYGEKGLSKENAYLRMRGHNLYDLINTIGTHICKNTHIPFEKKILKVMTASPSHYAEMDNLIQDVRHILL